MATSNSFLMDSFSDSLLAAVAETSFYGPAPPSIKNREKPITELKLPPAVIAYYQRSGILHLFAWQADCLEKANSSISTGKTIVSELLLIKSVLETKRKALFIELYVSIIIVDELYWIDELNHGYSLELLLSKIIYYNYLKITTNNSVKIIDMSATIPNLNQLAQWFDIEPVGLDSELACLIPMGIAFHHAGLTIDKRELIENAYRVNVICVIVCTNTLAS
ncbi:unnamed protein product [Rotaria sp. Silwood1]|nr:unnamed protein product [Rotaria sp. Silwood1]